MDYTEEAEGGSGRISKVLNRWRSKGREIHAEGTAGMLESVICLAVLDHEPHEGEQWGRRLEG